MKIWTWGSSPRSGSGNAWTQITNINGASCLSKVWNFFGANKIISCCDWRSWTKPGYIAMSRRQSKCQWSEGIAAQPTPNYSEWKIRWESFCLDFLGSFIVFQRAILLTRRITHFCYCNWKVVWRKNAAGFKDLLRFIHPVVNWHIKAMYLYRGNEVR